MSIKYFIGVAGKIIKRITARPIPLIRDIILISDEIINNAFLIAVGGRPRDSRSAS